MLLLTKSSKFKCSHRVSQPTSLPAANEVSLVQFTTLPSVRTVNPRSTAVGSSPHALGAGLTKVALSANRPVRSDRNGVAAAAAAPPPPPPVRSLLAAVALDPASLAFNERRLGIFKPSAARVSPRDSPPESRPRLSCDRTFAGVHV
jgi:hypothetical protein